MKFRLLLALTALLLVATNICFSQEIKVMSYNIRLDHPGDGPNRWEHRKSKVASLLNYYEADFIGCQEVLYQQLTYLDSNLKGYNYIGVGRDDGNQAGEYSTIFYMKDRYDLITSSTFWLSPTPDQPSKGWDAALNRVCTYGLFRHKQSQQEIWVFNTHFDHVGKEARAASAQLILEKIKQLNQNNAPVILCGDFNTRPEEAPAQILGAALWNTRDKSHLIYGDAATWNAFEFNKKPAGCIDYIFTTPFPYLTVKKFATLTNSYELKYPSDHFPILATLQLNQPFIGEINNFKKQDKSIRPSPGKVLFIGSSSFTIWRDIQNYFPASSIINRGFGGSTLFDLNFYFNDIVPNYQPRQIVIYCGENDLASSDTITSSIVLQRYQELHQRIRSLYPSIPLVYVSIKPSPSRWHLREKAKESNQLIKDFLAKEPRNSFVNVWDLMLNQEGVPNEKIFGSDRLHMNAEGYKIWKAALEPLLMKD